MRCLKDRPPAADLFGVKGRAWLNDQQLPACERETVDAGLRQVDFLDTELAQVDQLIAADALGWPEVKRLMSVPGVNVIVAATFMAAVGFAALATGRDAPVDALAWDGERVRRTTVRAAELVPSPYLGSLAGALAAL